MKAVLIYNDQSGFHKQTIMFSFYIYELKKASHYINGLKKQSFYIWTKITLVTLYNGCLQNMDYNIYIHSIKPALRWSIPKSKKMTRFSVVFDIGIASLILHLQYANAGHFTASHHSLSCNVCEDRRDFHYLGTVFARHVCSQVFF